MEYCVEFRRKATRSRVVVRALLLAVLAVVLPACSDERSADTPPEYGPAPGDASVRYLLGVHPLHNPQKLLAVYGPLVDALNRSLHAQGATIALEASNNYADFERKVARRKFAFIVPNPLQLLDAVESGYVVFAKMVDDDFRGVILVAADSTVRTPADLKGATVAYPAPTALAGTMLPQLYMVEHGLGSIDETTSLYVGSQESAIVSVLSGRSQAGCTWPVPWRIFSREHPDEAVRLRVAWQTPPLPSIPLAVRDDVPDPVAQTVKRVLLAMADDPACRPILDSIPTRGFVPADLETYTPVRDFLARYEAAIGRGGR